MRIAIVQEYVPRYRQDFFAGLAERLRDSGIECVVIAGHPAASQASRGDAAGSAHWLNRAEPHQLIVGHRTLYFYGSSKNWRAFDGVVFELRGTSIDLHAEILKKPCSGRRVGVWGHVKPYVNAGHLVDLKVERYQMMRSDHIFAYTRSGADYAVAAGVDPSRVTCVMNSINVSGLLSAIDAMSNEKVRDFQVRHGLKPGKCFGYIGGLDESKRVDFICAVLDHIWQLDPEIKFLIGGQGNQSALLLPAVERGQVVLLGYAGASEKALIIRCSEALINPGRVGLIAVECIATGIPVITTAWKFHGPEVEYLRPDVEVLESGNNVAEFASIVTGRTNDRGRFPMHTGREFATLQKMVENFAKGVETMMA